MPLDTQDVNRRINTISQLAIIIAIIAVVFLIVLYAVLRNQQEEMRSVTNNNVHTESISQTQLRASDTQYENTVSALIQEYVNGTASAQQTGLELEKVSVTSAYKSVHAQLSALFFGVLSDEDKKAQLIEMDQQYSWMIP
ncbi:MAG: hypothetical protein KIH62_003885 [Candidatus Kerfeldbacteria bacterium]|nr:hypothetical protein [Candidatus Kerfeldbacteria bacterium]